MLAPMIVYCTKFQEMSKCPICGTSRYKVKDEEESSSDEDDAKDLTWHANGRISDGMDCHPADCS